MTIQQKKPKPGKVPMPLPDQVALVLQGGGALGSYQAGVYDALCRHEVDPSWVAGISIGAINAALIAGNPPEQRVARLTEFLELISGGFPNFCLPHDHIREATHLMAAGSVALWGVPGFFQPHGLSAWWAPSGTDAALSFYDTTPLRETLDRLVDWDLLNHGPTRF